MPSGCPDRYVTLVGPDDRGVARMLRISSYHSPKGSGVDITSGVPPHPSDPSNYLGNALIPGDGERRCLNCHTTNFHSVEFNVGPESTDHSIGCEGCHGPGGNHVLARKSGIRRPGDRRAQELHGPDGQRRLRTLPRDRPRRDRHRRGGRPRLAPLPIDHDVSQPMLYRRAANALHCVTCHDPHKNAETSPVYYESKCQACHGPGKTPCPVNAASGCIECHMPRIWVQPTHAFKSDHNIRVHARRPASP